MLVAFLLLDRQHFGADAVVHVAKHGNLEWLPGKSVALSSRCYPEVALVLCPFVPFIVTPARGLKLTSRSGCDSRPPNAADDSCGTLPATI